jgi:NAD dependent epimerase/dehydratase family enzyme
MAEELLLGGQRVLPTRLLDSGYQFQFPNLGPALHRVLARAS